MQHPPRQVAEEHTEPKSYARRKNGWFANGAKPGGLYASTLPGQAQARSWSLSYPIPRSCCPLQSRRAMTVPKFGRAYPFCYQWRFLHVSSSVENVVVKFATHPTFSVNSGQNDEVALAAELRDQSLSTMNENRLHLRLGTRFIGFGMQEASNGVSVPGCECRAQCPMHEQKGDCITVWHAYCLCQLAENFGEREKPQRK